jgi:tetratricopeptide (TPR) repeat protein
MWLRASTELAAAVRTRARRAAPAARAHIRVGARRGGHALAALALLCLAACSSSAPRPTLPEAQPVAGPGAYTGRSAAAGAAATPSQGVPARGAAASGSPGAVAPRPEVPPEARADFARAVDFMRAGDTIEAESGFKQVALQYPQFAAPLVNLAILERKDGHLEEAEQTLKSAVARESGSAVAWTELGATQRMRGEFKDAATSYEQAIAADPHYAPAWRNLGVLSDLYLGDPNRALQAFEQYKQLTGEDKPVSGWIAELRARLGLAPLRHPAAAEPAPGAAEGSPSVVPGGAPPTAPAGAPSDATPSSPAPAPAPQPPASQPQADSPANAAAASAAPTAGE